MRPFQRALVFLVFIAPVAEVAYAGNCSTPENLEGKHGTQIIGVTGENISDSIVNNAIGRWNNRCDGGFAFPELRNGSGEIPITVTKVAGKDPDPVPGSSGCGKEQTMVNGSKIVGSQIWIYTKNVNGGLCRLADTLAHELGHALGLRDEPDIGCAGTMMGAPIGTQDRQILQASCNDLNGLWTTFAEIEFEWCYNAGGTYDECYSPLILDLGQHGLKLLGQPQGVLFDIDADGQVELTGWIAQDDTFLVWDFDGSGQIEGGQELFGEFSGFWPDLPSHGFAALARLDSVENGGNGDGLFDHDDAAFGVVQLWLDANKDGLTDAGELISLSAIVHSVDLMSVEEPTPKKKAGHILALKATVTLIDGTSADLYDVLFRSADDVD